MRFREYMDQIAGIENVKRQIIKALDGNPDDRANSTAKLTQFKDAATVYRILRVFPPVAQKPAALTAIQSNPNLTVDQLAGILAGEQ